MNQLNAVIADNQKLFVSGFKHILSSISTPEQQVNIVASAETSAGLFEKLQHFAADIIFLELNLPDVDVFSIIPKLKEEFPHSKVCVLSLYTEQKFVKSAFQVGADGFYSKLNDTTELYECIKSLMLGNRFLSDGLYITPPPRAKQINIKKSNLDDRFLMRQKLTRREQEILNLITKAMNNKEIAEQLYISDQTVGVHRKNIMRKLGVRNTVNLIKFALDYQLV